MDSIQPPRCKGCHGARHEGPCNVATSRTRTERYTVIAVYRDGTTQTLAAKTQTDALRAESEAQSAGAQVIITDLGAPIKAQNVLDPFPGKKARN